MKANRSKNIPVPPAGPDTHATHRLFTDASGQVINVVSGVDRPVLSAAPWAPAGVGTDRASAEKVKAQLCDLQPGEPLLTPSGIIPTPTYQSVMTDFRVFPWGAKNTMPIDIMMLLKDDNLARPILRKQLGLFWGRGPQLFSNDALLTDIPEFMVRSRWKHTLLSCLNDNLYTSCAAAMVIMHPDMKSIAQIRYLPVWQVRLAVRYDDDGIIPTHALVADFSGPFSNVTTLEPQAYPLYDPSSGENPRYPVTIVWMQDVDYFANPYPLPIFAGGEEWIRRAIEAPRIISSFIDNNMTIRWIVHIPTQYWADLRSKMIESYVKQGKTQEEGEAAYQTEKQRIINDFVNMLSGAKHVGKAAILEIATEIMGNTIYEYKWKIEQVDLKVGDFIKTMIEISDSADAKKTGAFSLHAALANVGQTGRADSGSEQLYAYNNHLFSSVSIPQFIVVDTLAELFSIATNTRIDIRFDRPIQQRQEDLSASNRLSTQSA